MGTLLNDLVYGIRILAKSKSFTLVAVISLALGIGANSAIFSLLDKLVIRSLPVENPQQLVTLTYTSDNPRGGGISTNFGYLDYADYRDHNEVFSGLISYFQAAFSLSNNGQTERVYGMVVSGNYFSVLGVNASLGRTFLPEEDKTPDTHPVAVISRGLWQRRYGADPAIIGKSINLNGHLFTVVGIAPGEFTGTIRGFTADIYVPIMVVDQAIPSFDIDSTLTKHMLRWLYVMGRLKPGVTRQRAEVAMTTLSAQLLQDGRIANAGKYAPKFILQDGSKGFPRLLNDISYSVLIMMAAVALVLLIACANVANLLLARASVRRREIAIRVAVGASRSRLIRQLLTESLLLSLLGGSFGMLLAYLLSSYLSSFTPPNSYPPLTLDSRIDLRSLLFTVALSFLTGIVFGLLPALQASKLDLVTALKDDSQSNWRGSRKFTLRNVLVAGQIALSVVVLINAGLCVRSLQKLNAIDPGFQPSKILVMSMDLELNGYDETRGHQFYSSLLDLVAEKPGVEAATLGVVVPLTDGVMARGIGVEGYKPGPNEIVWVDFNLVGPDYFRTLGTPLLRGRDFNKQDDANSQPVAVVNEAFVKRYVSDGDPMSKHLNIRSRPSMNPMTQIVGVVKDSRNQKLTEETKPAMFLPLSQRYSSPVTLHVRTANDPRKMIANLRDVVRSLDQNLPVYGIQTLEDQKDSSLYSSRMAAILLTCFGLLAVLLAAIGLYGVMSYLVGGRTREIGIRMALGAQRQDVLRLVMTDGLWVVVVGLLVGLGGAFACTRLASAFLYGITATDPVTFVSISILLAAVALIANYVPARRALRVDPMSALRVE